MNLKETIRKKIQERNWAGKELGHSEPFWNISSREREEELELRKGLQFIIDTLRSGNFAGSEAVSLSIQKAEELLSERPRIK